MNSSGISEASIWRSFTIWSQRAFVCVCVCVCFVITDMKHVGRLNRCETSKSLHFRLNIGRRAAQQCSTFKYVSACIIRKITPMKRRDLKVITRSWRLCIYIPRTATFRVNFDKYSCTWSQSYYSVTVPSIWRVADPLAIRHSSLP